MIKVKKSREVRFAWKVTCLASIQYHSPWDPPKRGWFPVHVRESVFPCSKMRRHSRKIESYNKRKNRNNKIYLHEVWRVRFARRHVKKKESVSDGKEAWIVGTEIEWAPLNVTAISHHLSSLLSCTFNQLPHH